MHGDCFIDHAGFTLRNRLATPIKVTRLNRFACATAHSFAFRGFDVIVTFAAARLATCPIANLHG